MDYLQELARMGWWIGLFCLVEGFLGGMAYLIAQLNKGDLR